MFLINISFILKSVHIYIYVFTPYTQQKILSLRSKSYSSTQYTVERTLSHSLFNLPAASGSASRGGARAGAGGWRSASRSPACRAAASARRTPPARNPRPPPTSCRGSPITLRYKTFFLI